MIGIVDFADNLMREAAIEALDKKPFPNVEGSQDLKVLAYKAHPQNQTNLCIKGLPITYQESQLRALFSAHGQVRSIRLKHPNLSLYQD